MKVTGETPGKLAAAAREAGAQFVFISTSGIFGGEKEGPFSEEEPPQPGTAYARAKVVGEERVKKEHPQALILRAGWLFGGPLEMRKNFVGARLREAEGKEVIRSATDKRGSPTWTRDFAERALELLEKETSGLVHLVNAGGATRHEYVVQILNLAGRSVKVDGVKSAVFPRAAGTPKDERLKSIKFKNLRDWKRSLFEYLKSLGYSSDHFKP
jgi:dTDP-4-dehydrorhamnose reductase